MRYGIRAGPALAEGLRRRPPSLVRRHLRTCKRCTVFRGQLKQTNKALAALLPIGPMVLLKKPKSAAGNVPVH